MAAKLEISEKLACILKGAQLPVTPLPLTPEIRLYLLSEAYPQRTLTEEDRHRLMEEPFFWPFCWPSGQVLARWLRGGQAGIAGKRLLDFGSGSGVVAIAAALYGARAVTALDIDPLSCKAIRANAELNGVSLEITSNFSSLADGYDLILAADILYDRDNLSLLEKFAALADRVVIADSRIKELPPPYKKIGQRRAVTLPDLGDPEEFRNVSIFAYPD